MRVGEEAEWGGGPRRADEDRVPLQTQKRRLALLLRSTENAWTLDTNRFTALDYCIHQN